MPGPLYAAGIAALRLGTRAYGLVNAKAAHRAEGAAAALRLLSPTPPGRDCYWMHCASVGEFEQGRPVWDRLMALHPEARFVLTFFSPSGVEWFADRSGVGEVGYLPWDTPAAARAFVTRLSPKLALFVKYEWWRATHAALREASVPAVVFSVAFRQNQPFFRAYHPLHRGYRELLEGLAGLFVQSESSARLLAEHGYRQPARIAGDTRLDRVLRLASEPFADERIEAWLAGRTSVLVAGSTWPPDEEVLAAFLDSRPDYCLVCAPHEVNDAARERLARQFDGFAPAYYATGASGDEFAASPRGPSPSPGSVRGSRVLLLDAKGVLAKAYRYGRLAYVGGGFGAGIHNILEPVAYRIPVAIGPRYGRFDEALALVALGVVVACAQTEDLLTFARRFDDEDELARAHATAGDYLDRHGGATDAIIDFLRAQRLV